jgi:hypothetical protein
MSQKRQTAIFDRLGNRHAPITTLARDCPAGHLVALHFHDRDQLVYGSRGVMTVRTGNGTWVVPAQPAFQATSGQNSAEGMLRRKPVAAAKRINSAGLSRCFLRKTSKSQRRLIAIIIDQLEVIQMVPLQLPNPSDPRALRVASTLLADPSDRRPLIQLCKGEGASKRTVERLFQEDVGMSFG